MKKVSSSSVGSQDKQDTYKVAVKPSLTETVQKYGGIITDRDGDKDKVFGKLKFIPVTLNDLSEGKILTKEDIFLNGKLLGSKG